MVRIIPDATDWTAAPEARAEGGDAHSIGEFMLRRLRQDIVSTELRPGMKLALHHLARQYGVGITPLRDALGQLAGDGLVIMESQKGFRVAPISPPDFRDVCDIRLRVELMALGMAIDRGDAHWDARMKRAHGVFVRLEQRVGAAGPISEEWETLHRGVHMALLSGCGSPTLLRFIDRIHDRFHRYRRIALPTMTYMCPLAADHTGIMEAAAGRDRARAQHLLEQHIVSSTRLIEDHI